MSLKKYAAVAALTLAAAGCAQAEVVSIVQVFNNVSWYDYGVSTGLGYGENITGDWIFKATVDTSLPNQYEWPTFGAMYTTSKVTLTQVALGLVDEPILNLNYFYVFPDMVGLDVSSHQGSVWTRTKYTENLFTPSDTFPLTLNGSLPASTHDWNGFGPQWDGFLLSNGSRIYGGGSATLSTIQISSVPEADTWALFAAGFGVAVAAASLRRRQASHAALPR